MMSLPKELIFIFIFLFINCGCTDFGSSISKTAEISKRSDTLVKTEIFNDNYLYAISGLAYGELDQSDGPEIAIAGIDKVFYVDLNGKIKKKINLDYNLRYNDTIREFVEIEFVDVENDNSSEYMVTGGYFMNPALFDHNGNLKWIDRRDDYRTNLVDDGTHDVEDMACGDVDGDGILEFTAGYIFGKGLVLFDINGDEIWRDEPLNVQDVAMTDIDADGSDEIIASNIHGEYFVYDKDGTVIKSINIKKSWADMGMGAFTLVKWPEKFSDIGILSCTDNSIKIHNLNAVELLSIPIEKIRFTTGTIKATTVKLVDNEPEYLAVMIYPEYPNNVHLFLFDNLGQLVHKEDVADRPSPLRFRTTECGALATMPSNEDGTEVLLVGQRGTVWKYEFQTQIEGAIREIVTPEKPKSTDIVKFTDKTLELGIRRAISKPDGEIIVDDLDELAELEISRLSTPSVKEFGDETKTKEIPVENLTDIHQKIKSLEGLQYCTNLFSLKLDRNEITDLSPISNLKNLAKIDFSNNLITDLSPIASLNNLASAKFRNNEIHTMGEMNELYNLLFIDLGKNKIRNLDSISNLTNLAVLLVDDNEISDVSLLSKLPLEELDISRNQIKDISPLVNISSLFILRTAENEIGNPDNMQMMSNLKILDLSRNKIKNIEPFVKIPAIRAISLSNNQIKNINAVRNWSFFQEDMFRYSREDYEEGPERSESPLGYGMTWSTKSLGLPDNQITDLSPLLEMKGLDEKMNFWIGGNPLNEESLKKVIPALEEKGVKIYMEDI